ncbi:MAG TPA: TetR/AcrR family transcriptional regulator [Jatrophihabitantaceae bacterium]
MTALIARQRKRGAELEDAIHDAVFAELADVGYAGFTVEAVAARAKTGKASIYRRWGTKQDLVVEAFLARFGGPGDILEELRSEPGATTRELLVRLATRICEASDAAGEVMRAVACEATRDPELAAAVEQKVHNPKRAAFVELLRRGVERGEVRPDAACSLYADILPAMLTYQMVLNNQRVTEQDAIRIVDHVVLPLIAPAG